MNSKICKMHGRGNIYIKMALSGIMRMRKHMNQNNKVGG